MLSHTSHDVLIRLIWYSTCGLPGETISWSSPSVYSFVLLCCIVSPVCPSLSSTLPRLVVESYLSVIDAPTSTPVRHPFVLFLRSSPVRSSLEIRHYLLNKYQAPLNPSSHITSLYRWLLTGTNVICLSDHHPLVRPSLCYSTMLSVPIPKSYA